MKFRKPAKPTFQLKHVTGYTYNNAADFPKLSVVYMVVNGKHGLNKNVLCDRAYYVESGQGSFLLNNQEITVEKGDVCVIPRDTVYDFWSDEGMALVLFDAPAWQEGSDVHQ